MEIAIETTKQDWVAFRAAELVRERGILWPFVARALVPPILIATGLAIVCAITHGWLSTVFGLLALLAAPLYLGSSYVLMKRKFAAQVEQAIQASTYAIGKTEVQLSEEGMTVVRGSNVFFKNWKEVARVTADGDYGYVFFSADNIVIIPRRCFQDQISFEMFMKAAVIFHWHGENAIKEAAKAAAHGPKQEPPELKPLVVPMPVH